MTLSGYGLRMLRSLSLGAIGAVVLAGTTFAATGTIKNGRVGGGGKTNSEFLCYCCGQDNCGYIQYPMTICTGGSPCTGDWYCCLGCYCS